MNNETIDAKTLKKEIDSLRNTLKAINDDKERWFKKKEDLKKEMQVLIEKIKALQKDNDTSKVDQLKKERDKYNAEVKILIERIKALKQEKEVFLKKHGIKEDPETIKKTIEKIEEKIETEVLSIDKERKLMDQIKRMKKNYEALGDSKILTTKIDEISRQIEENKKKANEYHEELKKALKEKKKWYNEFFSLSKQINLIKKQQESAFAMFISFKNSFLEVSKQLGVKLSLIKKEKKDFEDIKKEKKKRKEETELEFVEEKRKKVEEKMKKGEKLTTEDLLVMQTLKHEEETKDI